jgi:hypothetical protein
MPAFFGGTTKTRLLICLLLHPIVLEGAEAIGRSSGAEKVTSQLRRGKITFEQAEEKIVQNSLSSFYIKILMSYFRRFMLLNIGSTEATIAAIVGASVEESIERGFLVEFDNTVRRWRGKPQLQGEALRLQQLVWMCDANQSAVAEIIAIVVASFAQVLLEQHAVIFALGYSADTKLDIAAVFVQLMVELALEMAVDIVAMWAESEHGIPVTHYLALVQSGKTFIFQTAMSVLSLALVLYGFIRHPHIFSCDSSYVCDCVEQPQYSAWFIEVCNTSAPSTNRTGVDDEADGMFDSVNPLTVIVGLVTGLAMLALIALSVLFARYRKRNNIVGALEASVATAQKVASTAQHAANAAMADNVLLKRSLDAAQQIVDRNVKEGGAGRAAYKLRHADLALGVQLGEGSFGTVFYGTYRGRECAVKTVRATKVTDEIVQAFLGELTLMAPLRHPNLVGLVGGCWTDGPDKLCIVLEYCSRGSLGCMAKDPSNTWEEHYHDITLGVALCFQYLHHEQPGKPLIHRDLKPDNVLIAGDGTAKVADFGESTRFEDTLAADEDDGALTMTMVRVL